MKLDFKNRMALYYMLATALIMTLVFAAIFFIVRNSVYDNLDHTLSFEVQKHMGEITFNKGSIYFKNKAEWEEIEHHEVQVNPVFIEIFDAQGKLTDKSPNLKEDTLQFDASRPEGDHFNSFLNNRPVRQVQVPISEANEVKGYITTAIPLESSLMVITNLRNTLLILFPLILILLFFISRYLAGKNIIPIMGITETTNRITRHNLSERVNLPGYEDELYDLSSSINELLDRIEDALARERQFTADASHELRTPLASLRGNLEILIRKKRQPEEYEQRIRGSLMEIDRMTRIVEQLLFLARFDSKDQVKKGNPVSLVMLLDETLGRYHREIEQKKLKVAFRNEQKGETTVPQYYSGLILDNLISNAIKYSEQESDIQIRLFNEGTEGVVEISDEGIGIKKEDLEKIFSPFYRSEALGHKEIKGNGLGLSIARKAATSIGAEIDLKSEPAKGTTAKVIFHSLS
ncbi:MAG: HAMP domain-containing sensor histidine kinase [Salegentibacter sp.]